MSNSQAPKQRMAPAGSTLTVDEEGWTEAILYIFGRFSLRHLRPLPPTAAVWARFQLHHSPDMCRALETAGEWLSLTSIFPDRPHWWLLGKQGTVVRASVVKRLVTGGRGEGPDWSTALGLQRSHRKMESNTKKKKEGLCAPTESVCFI